MKAVVSLPDTLLEAADELAKRLGISRSELFAAALEAYLGGHRRTEVTERLLSIYPDVEPSLDPVMAAVQSASSARDDSEREQEMLARFNEAGAWKDGGRQGGCVGLPSPCLWPPWSLVV